LRALSARTNFVGDVLKALSARTVRGVLRALSARTNFVGDVLKALSA